MDNLLHTIREDDFVEYFIFPLKGDEEKLTKLLEDSNNIIKKYSEDYLWHKDPIKLSIRNRLTNVLAHIEGDTKLPPHLHGVSHYGDNIDDEWFIVFLLNEISKKVKDIAIRVHDADGEFILIEAANCLPGWTNPNACQNCVYLYQGSVRLLQPETDQEMTIESAIRLLPSSKQNKEIQQAIDNKLKGFPEKQPFHYANAIVPVAVASLLTMKPNLISAAIVAFSNRDSVDAKVCRAMKYFPPEDCVKIRVKFTRCLYAMVSHSKYLPDTKVGWKVPTTENLKASLLGIKIACGFEILASQAKSCELNELDKGWLNYLESVKNRGFFEEYLEHSMEHTRRLNMAKEFYRSHQETMRVTPPIGKEIVDLLKSGQLEQVAINQDNLQDDDDDESWLNISSDDLDKMLEDQYGVKPSTTQNIAGKLNSFLTHVSDYEGAEFPSMKVDFKPDCFSSAIQEMLAQLESNDLNISDSDMSDYENDNLIDEPKMENGVKNKMQKYMEEMDKELAETTMGQSFIAKPNEDVENFRPVDLNVNALKNIMESYKAQMGEAGPSSNMLGPMGMHLETNE